jgi:four helix bundle protein
VREGDQQLPLIPTSENFQDLPIFVKWTDFLKWLLHTTEKFPKKARFTFSDRINNLALGIVEELVEARYTSNKRSILRSANLRLEKLRMLLRISYESRFLSKEAYKHAMYSLNEVGKMLGGWIKQQEAKV